MKWVCTEHDQDKWTCVRDNDGYVYHVKKYNWPEPNFSPNNKYKMTENTTAPAANMSKDNKILKKAHEARQFLRIHGFLPDKENERVAWRIDKEILKLYPKKPAR